MHIQYNLAKFGDIYRGSAVILGGDTNNLPLQQLCDVYPELVCMVNKPTHGNNILDVLLTDAVTHYDVAQVFPPIKPDDDKYGAPSDHCVVVMKPVNDKSARKPRVKTEVRRRNKFTMANIAKLGLLLATMTWTRLYDCPGVSEMSDMFDEEIKAAVNMTCPIQTTVVKHGPKQVPSSIIADLSKQKSKIYKKEGNSKEYKRIKAQIKAEKRKFTTNRIEEAVSMAGPTNAWIRKVAKFGDHPGADHSRVIRLPEHVERGLSEVEQATEFARFFGGISAEYPALEPGNLPPRVQEALADAHCVGHPHLPDHIVHQILESRKVTSSVTGDIHPKIIK